MASPPITNRVYAYFSVTGKGSYTPVSEALDLKCTNAWAEGDISPKTGKPHRFMRWSLESGLDDTHSLNDHVEKLLSMLSPFEEELRHLSMSYQLTLQCVGYFHPSGHGVHFSKEVIAQAANLSLCIDADFYYIDDHGHDLDWY